jgi:Rad3-related DNA helicase
MGGIFAEGIDLAGDSLIGAVVVGIGLPGLSYEREAIAAYYGERYDAGREFAYVYPGMNRVLQAAGRVIRREEDRGVIVLIDDRFDDPIYKKSLPDLWEGLKYIEDAKTLNEELLNFWNEESR